MVLSEFTLSRNVVSQQVQLHILPMSKSIREEHGASGVGEMQKTALHKYWFSTWKDF